MLAHFRIRVILALGLLLPGMRAGAEDCSERKFNSTFELIQDAIFEKRGCAEAICHGEAASGGLDLRPEVAYDELIDVPGETVPSSRRVMPGEKRRSLLFLNLAAKTYPDEYQAPLRAMPLDPVPALTAEELELMRIWIEAGAPKEGTVHGTEQFDPCLPPPEPVAIKPLDPPAPGTGIQIRMPRWSLPAHSESEVCFASYYDVTDQVPAEFRSPDGKHFRYKRNEVRQDNLSHHLIVNVYEGSTAPTSPEWGSFSCRGGDKDGQSCDPTDLTFCGEGLCSTSPVRSVACIGFGPGDSGVGLQTAPLSGIQKTAATFEYAPDVYNEAPLKGMVLWNSHAFNLSDTEGKLEAWLNFDFAPPEEQKIPTIQIFNADEIFKMNAKAFSTDEPCSLQVLPGGAHLFELSSHGHQRMKRWRTFLGAFRCEDGPAQGQACSPLGYDFDSPDVCQGARCISMVKKRVGDCDTSGDVTVDEIVFTVNLALGKGKFNDCREADGDGDRNVTVDEVITAVTAALQGVPPPEERDPEESLLYVSTIYNDPVVVRFDPELVMPGRVAPADERTLTFCALYDNGYTDPAKVKRASTSPAPPVSFPGIGGPCSTEARVCASGKVGEACVGRSQVARDRSCDTATASNDGTCDACPLGGGVTTEDEMFLLLGQYYVP